MAKKNEKDSNYYNKINFSDDGRIKNIGKGDGFDSDGSLKSDKLKQLLRSDMVLNSTDNRWLTRFSRFGYIDPYNHPTSNKEYIFITKPDLHLFEGKNPDKLNEELKYDVYFKDMFNRYRHIMNQLQYSVYPANPYLTLLTNSVASSLDLPDIVGLESDTNENIYGDKLSYRHGSESGDVGHEFSLEFYDTKYLEIYHLFKMWDMYENLKTKGKVTPPDESYITNMELHDQVSAYKIIVADDMETILFYAKLYGVYPKGVPRSQFGSLDDGPIKLNVDFKSAFVLDNDPTIIDDFNRLATVGTSKKFEDLKSAKIWNKKYGKVDKRFVGKPFIVKDKNIKIGDGSAGTKGMFKLKWIEVN